MKKWLLSTTSLTTIRWYNNFIEYTDSTGDESFEFKTPPIERIRK